MYAGQRTLRLADGPDEVHWHVVGRSELRATEAAGIDYDPKRDYYENLGGDGGGVFSGP